MSDPIFTAQAGDNISSLVELAIRDYLVEDLSSYDLPSVVELLPNGATSIIQENNFTENTETPVLMLADLGDGGVPQNSFLSLQRYILYCIDRSKGLNLAKEILYRARLRFNKSDLVTSYFTGVAQSSNQQIKISRIECGSSTATATLTKWRVESKALYLFLQVEGLQPVW